MIMTISLSNSSVSACSLYQLVVYVGKTEYKLYTLLDTLTSEDDIQTIEIINNIIALHQSLVYEGSESKEHSSLIISNFAFIIL